MSKTFFPPKPKQNWHKIWHNIWKIIQKLEKYKKIENLKENQMNIVNGKQP